MQSRNLFGHAAMLAPILGALALTAGITLTGAAQAASEGAAFEYGSYLRAGTGLSLQGTKHECFSNAGASGNEFRLGNECGLYGEVTGRALLLRGEKRGDPFMKVQTTFAFFPAGDRQYEDSDLDGRDINLVEAYAEGGFFDGVPMSFWAGKRFYRAGDVHMNDFYYFAAMSGTGAGVGDLDVGVGQLKLAVLHEAASQFDPVAKRDVRVQTTKGAIGKTALDAQLTELKLGDVDRLHLWGVLASTAPGFEASTGKTFESGRGWVFGIRHERTLQQGSNHLAVMYGAGVMESLSMWGGTALEAGANTVNLASRFRIVESLTTKIADRWATHFAATFERSDSGAEAEARSTWWNIGVRPMYFLSDHFHLVAEVGHSVVRREADEVNGSPIGDRTLTRVTFAPQVSMGRDIWARPTIRFYVTHSIWNADNKSFIAGGAPSYADVTSGTSLGVQTEVWF